LPRVLSSQTTYTLSPADVIRGPVEVPLLLLKLILSRKGSLFDLNKTSDKFKLEISTNNKNNRKPRKRIIELNLGDIACFVKPHSDFVCDTIVRSILPKRHNGLESPTVYVLVTDNKFDFYNITKIADKNTRY
jgi:hypothetical protein